MIIGNRTSGGYCLLLAETDLDKRGRGVGVVVGVGER